MQTDLTDIFKIMDSVLSYQLFELNKTPITVSSVLMFIVAILISFIFSRLFIRLMLRRILNRFHIEQSTQYMLGRLTHYAVMAIGTLVAFQFMGLDLSALAVIFGLLSVGIGFGLQNVTSNFVAGLILLFERPIKVGDRVSVGDTEGDVTAINMRSSTIRSLNNISIIVPNSDFIASRVINWSHGDPRIRVDAEVGVSYGSDLELVLKTLREVAEQNSEILREPAPDVLLSSFGDSSWNMLLRFWVDDPKRHHIIRSDINCEIVRKFRERKIEIPFPQRDLHIRSTVSAAPLPPS